MILHWAPSFTQCCRNIFEYGQFLKPIPEWYELVLATALKTSDGVVKLELVTDNDKLTLPSFSFAILHIMCNRAQLLQQKFHNVIL